MSKVLLVHAKGGPPLGHVLSRTAARAEVHLLALSALPPAVADSARRLCASVVTPTEAQRSDLVSTIVSRAGAVGADAVLTFSEYAVVAVAEACGALGLPGAGSAAALARDKRLMRRTWREHGLSQPEFRPVATEADLHEAAGSLSFPLLLKAAWSAGSTAHQIVRSPHELSAAWHRSREVMAESAQLGFSELHVAEADADFVVEEIVTGSAADWFDEPGWGDYVSVEGVVADGTFHPVCLSGRMPTVEPFTERAGITPAPLSQDAQDRVVALARESVDALGLRDCGIHTEVKLGADGRMWLIETAARFGGAMTVPQIEEVFGLDLVGMLVDQLLGRPVEWPKEALTPARARGAAGSLVVLAVDGRGAAWQDRRIWDFPVVAADVPLSRGSALSVVAESSLADGSPVPVYDPAAGANTMAALCLLSATDPRTVLHDFETLVDALPRVLPAARPEALPTARTEALPAARPQAPAAPRPQTLATTQPQALATARPQAPPAAQPEALPAAQPEAPAAPQPQALATAQPEALPAPQPQALPNALAAAQPEAPAAARPQALPTARPEALPATQTDALPAAQPQAPAATQPQALPTARPEALPATQTDALPAAQPQAPAATQPQALPTARPQALPAARTEPRAATQRDALPSAQPEAPAAPHPQALATAQTDALPAPHPQALPNALAAARPRVVPAAQTQAPAPATAQPEEASR